MSCRSLRAPVLLSAVGICLSPGAALSMASGWMQEDLAIDLDNWQPAQAESAEQLFDKLFTENDAVMELDDLSEQDNLNSNEIFEEFSGYGIGKEVWQTPGPWQADLQAESHFPLALAAIRDRKPTKAAILYVQLGPWPNYIKYVVRSAAANNGTSFYFVGPPLPELDDCANCNWLPFDLALAKTRITTLLGVSAQDAEHIYPTKLCDLKPMWPVLLPEITARHEWIGFADHDIIFGDIDAEIAALPPDAEMLVPKGFFPQPLSNGNFMMFRTTPKMLQAFKTAGNWDAIIREPQYLGFDEWWGVKPSMMEILVEMHLNGQLNVVPTLRPLIQDFTVTRPGAGFYGAGVDKNATVQIYWHRGRLAAKRRGMCVCPDPNSWQFAFMPLSGCSECMRQSEGGTLPDIMVNRTVEAFGFHFQAWKKKRLWKECPTYREENCSLWMPTCASTQGFHFGARGFSCWGPTPIRHEVLDNTSAPVALARRGRSQVMTADLGQPRTSWLGRLFHRNE